MPTAPSVLYEMAFKHIADHQVRRMRLYQSPTPPKAKIEM